MRPYVVLALYRYETEEISLAKAAEARRVAESMRGAEGVSANPYRTALSTTVRRDAPDPLRCPFRYHNVGASPAGRYGFLLGETAVPSGSKSTLPEEPAVASKGRDAPTLGG